MTKKGKYSLGFAVGSLLLCTVNYANWMRPTSCDDCYYDYGLPFAFLREGGFEHGRYILWPGVLGDLLTTLLVGLIVGIVFARFATRL
jgi:hypothetical protein